MDAIAEFVSNTFGPFMSISLLFAAISSGTWGSLFKILCKKPFRMPLFFRWSEDTDEPELLIFAVFILVSLISAFCTLNQPFILPLLYFYAFATHSVNVAVYLVYKKNNKKDKQRKIK